MGVPETFLIDAEGVVMRRWIGRFRPFDADNLDLIDTVVAESGGHASG